jgi:hypothetical protein
VLEAWLVDAGFATLAGGLLVATELERELAAGGSTSLANSRRRPPSSNRNRAENVR